MAQRIATIVLLVEDRNQENLLRRYLQRLGHGNRSIRVVKSKRGVGSGEQFVREYYASEVEALRRRLHQASSVLLAMIDADTRSIADRQRQFEDALRDGGQRPREQGEPLIELVTRRSVETWIMCLLGHIVNEETSYRHDPVVDANSIKTAAQQLYQWTRPNSNVPPLCVPSLVACLPEFRRIPGDN